MQEYSAKLVSALTKAIPYACLLLAIVALIFLFTLGRSDLAIKSLYLFIPVAVVSTIAIAKPSLFKEYSTDFLPKVSLSSVSFWHLVLIFILLYIVSLCLLIGSEERPLGYFILVGAMASLIFVEILASGKEHPGRKSIILFQIIFVSLNLIFGQTLRLPLFYGHGDVFLHMNYINTILETGQITPAMEDYQHFPIYHIFGATGTMMSGLNLQTSYFIFNGLLFIISIPVVYLLVSQVTKNIHLPLTAVLLYSLSREVIFNGMYMITRGMAFVFCFMILYLLIRGWTSLKLRSVALFLVVPLVLMHQTTLLHFSGILLILVIIEFLLYRRSWYIGFNFLLFFFIAYLGYWFWLSYPFVERVIIDVVSAPDIMPVPPPTLERPLFVIFTSNADLIVIAFLSLIGIISLLYAKRELMTVGAAFSLFSLVTFLVYFPGVTGFLAHLYLTYRLPLLVSPFIAFAMAGGLLLLVRRLSTNGQHWKSIITIGISVCIVFFLSLSSTVLLGNLTDLNLGKIFVNENRRYFTESELTAFSFSYTHGQDIKYYGDSMAINYMKNRLDTPVAESFNVFNPKSIKSGYMLFRKQELQSRGQLPFHTWSEGGSAGLTYTYQSSWSLDLQAEWEQENKIFDSGSLYIYMKKTPE